MSIETLTSIVKEKAQKEYEDSLESHNEKLSSLDDEFNSSLESFREKLSLKYESLKNSYKSRTLSRAKQQSSKIMLETKAELFESISKEFKEELHNLKPSKKIDVLLSMLNEIEDLNSIEVIECHKDDEKQVNEATSISTIVSNSISRGSLKLIGKGKAYYIDLTIEQLANQIIKEHTEELMRIIE